MRVLLQRVTTASVAISGKSVGSIRRGLLLLVGVSAQDTLQAADYLVQKIAKLRIFEDADGKTNLSCQEVSAQLLVVSQFTLYAQWKKGNRPGFSAAAPPDKAEVLFDYFVNQCKQLFPTVQTGRFDTAMQIELVNDGPFTLFLDSDRKE